MAEVVEAISKVNGIMSEIASASREQTIGIEQLNVAINLLDVTTQGKPLIVEGGAAINSQIVQRNVAGLIGK